MKKSLVKIDLIPKKTFLIGVFIKTNRIFQQKLNFLLQLHYNTIGDYFQYYFRKIASKTEKILKI